MGDKSKYSNNFFCHFVALKVNIESPIRFKDYFLIVNGKGLPYRQPLVKKIDGFPSRAEEENPLQHLRGILDVMKNILR